jgi:hypothetical protein
MNVRQTVVLSLGLLLAASSALAIAPGADLLIAGAARTNKWHSDLYINNAGSTTVGVTLYWLERDQPNPNPISRSFNIGADDTLILDDVLLKNFGLSNAAGAFRITATGGEVTANLIVFTGFNDPVGGTYGSGFEAIPAASATRAGESTTVMGLASNSSYYPNIFALAGADGVTMDLSLLAPNGNVLDTATVTLGAYEPWLSFKTDLWNVGTYNNGTVLATVSAGSAVILGSKTDNASGDPTTLESSYGAGAGSADGIYQFAVYDSLAFASGGNLEVVDDVVEAINGTYFNFDKVDGQGESVCTLIFLWGVGLNPTDLADFASGVEFVDSYPDGGEMTWTLTFDINDNLGFTGTLEAVGANFTGTDTGCNGAFPTLRIDGGKSN